MKRSEVALHKKLHCSQELLERMTPDTIGIVNDAVKNWRKQYSFVIQITSPKNVYAALALPCTPVLTQLHCWQRFENG